MKSTILSLFAVALAVYLFFCIYLYLFQRSFIYFPTPPADVAPAEQIWIDRDGARLRIWTLHPGKSAAIIYFGGNAEDVALNIPQFSDWFPQHSIYLVNYRGYGGSSGRPRERDILEDAAAIYDFVRQAHSQVSLIGRSLGAAVAVDVAARKQIDRLVLVTPFDSLAALARNYYPIFPTSLLLKDRYNSVSLAHRIQSPVLILAAGNDEIIPRDSTERLAAAMAQPLVTLLVIDDTGHNTVGSPAEYGKALRGFLSHGI